MGAGVDEATEEVNDQGLKERCMDPWGEGDERTKHISSERTNTTSGCLRRTPRIRKNLTNQQKDHPTRELCWEFGKETERSNRE